LRILITKTRWGEFGEERQALYIDDKWVESVGPLCENPEDAIIGRSLVACTDIVSYMVKAYEAGKKGEPFEVEIREEED